MPLSVSYGGVAQPDVAAMHWNGDFYRCYVWTDYQSNAIGTACYVMHDQGQWELLWHRKLVFVADAHSRPQVMARHTTGEFLLYFVAHTNPSTNELYLFSIDVDSLSTSPNWTQEFSIAMNASWLFSVDMLDDGTWLLAYHTVTGNISLSRRTLPLVAAWAVTHTETPVRCLAVYGSASNGTAMLAYEQAATGGDIRLHRRDAADGANPATTTPYSSSTAEVYRIGMCRSNTIDTALVAEITPDTASPDNRGLYYMHIRNSSGAALGTTHHTPWLTMLSRPFSWTPPGVSQRRVYCLAGFKSRLAAPNEWSQTHAFYVDLHADRWDASSFTIVTATPVSNVMLGSAVSVYATDNHLSHVSRHAPHGPALRTKTAAALQWTRITKRNKQLEPNNPMVVGAQFYLQDPWIAHDGGDAIAGDSDTFDDGPYPYTQFQTVPVARGLAVCGGTPALYDGVHVPEIGFCWWPEILSLTESGGGSLSTTGNYKYVAVYEWSDDQGQMHRSAPSLAASITLTSTNRTVNLQIMTQSLTLKTHERYEGGVGKHITIKVYRTTNGGSLFYAVTNYEAPVNNFASSYTVNHVDSLSDAEIQNNELLSLQLRDGVWVPLENWQPPASQAIAVWKNRLWLASGDELWYSHEVLPDAGGVIEAAPEFNPVNVFRLDDGGPVVAMASLDYAMVVFKSDRIHMLYGQGNDRIGIGSDLDSKRIGYGIGCVCSRSVVVGKDGVFFQSEKGIYLLNRSEELVYIGAGIEDFVRACGNVRSAVVNDDNHQLRIVASRKDNTAQYVFVFDYLFNMWMTTILPGPTDAVVDGVQWRGYESDNPIAVLRENGDILLERFDATPYVDGNAPELTESTIPMKIETTWLNFAGVDGFGRCRSIMVHAQRKNSCTIKIKLAYDHNAYDAQDEHTITLTEDVPIRVRPRRQKFSSIKVLITDEDESQKLENISISGLAFDLRPRTGHRRVSTSQIAR